jgi:hypothetical protein
LIYLLNYILFNNIYNFDYHLNKCKLENDIGELSDKLSEGKSFDDDIIEPIINSKKNIKKSNKKSNK